jgi:hypothetical protein
VGSSDAARKPYFFLSYVHDQGEDDESVGLFFKKLHHDVILHSGHRGQAVGFCDSTLRIGDRWSPMLLDALCTCTAFIALCSPTYFESAACGKEWTIFSRRLEQSPTGRNGPSSLIPLQWIPMQLPSIAAPFQYRDRAFGAAYDEYGLRDLIQIRDHDGDYRRFVNALVRRVVDLARTVTVPLHPERPAFDDIPSAFQTAHPVGHRAGGRDPRPAAAHDRRLPGADTAQPAMPRLRRWEPPDSRQSHSTRDGQQARDEPQ